MFLYVKGAAKGVIQGEAEDASHKNEIEVLGWSWGMQQRPFIGGTTATGRATLRELEIWKNVDAASTALMSALRHNEVIEKAVLTVRKGSGQDPLEYLVITLQGGRVASLDVKIEENSPNASIAERVTIAFNKIRVEYQTQNKTGAGKGKMVFEDEWTPSA
jgi:type VI secretion system secreted protein Hcp